ncbi:MAG: hypothetical protein AAGI46_07480 [Planctomycetota bacterium]
MSAQRDRHPFAPPPGPGQGGTANVIAAIASAILPGLGQLAQGRIAPAIFFFVVDVTLWVLLSIICLGWLALVIHAWACLDAALWEPT